MQRLPVKENIRCSVGEDVLYAAHTEHVCCWHRWLWDFAIKNPFGITSYVNWHHFSEAVKHCELLHKQLKERREEERARKQRKTGWNLDWTLWALSHFSDWSTSHHTALKPGTGHIFDMHRCRHTHIFTCTLTHTDLCAERDRQTQCRERQCRPGTSSAAGPDVDKSSPFSTGIHPQTACPPRRPLSLQPTTAHLLPPRWNLAVLPSASASPPLLQHTHTQHLAAANFNPREDDEDEGEGRCRETLRDGERRRPSGEKRGEGDVPVGSRGSKRPASRLARELPQSCSGPYLLLLLLHWSVCAFLWWTFVCVQETERETLRKSRKEMCMCGCICRRVSVILSVCVCVSAPRCSLTFLKYSASRPPDALPVWPCVSVTD